MWSIKIIVSILALSLLNNIAIASDIRDADASQISLTNLRELDGNGKYPAISPDGTKILFTKFQKIKQGLMEQSIPSLWIMNIDGSNKLKIIDNALNGAWSPDMKRVAYLRGSNLYLYDLINKRDYNLNLNLHQNIPMGGFHGKRIIWAKNGNKIFVQGGYNIPNYVDLETLKVESAYWMGISDQYFSDYYKNKMFWMERNLSLTHHPKVLIYDESMEPSKETWSGGKLWIANRDGGYKKLLLKETQRVSNISLTPDCSKIIFEGISGFGKNTDVILIGTLETIGASVKDLPIKHVFSVKIKMADYINNKWFRGFMNEESLKKYLAMGKIKASIFNAKVNPLTGKTIGAGDKLKGEVQITQINNDYTIVKVIEEKTPFNIGDVMARIRTDDGQIQFDNDVFGILQSHKTNH